MNTPPRTKVINGVKFTEGEVFCFKDRQFFVVNIGKRSISFRPYRPKNNQQKEST